QRPRAGSALRGAARLPVDGGEFSVVAGYANHPHRISGRHRGHRLDALRHRDQAERASADGRDDDRRRRDREQHPDGHLRQREARRRPFSAASRAARRQDTPAPGDDDGAGDDHRHAADGALARRRRRTERAARSRGDRRPPARHLVHALLRSGHVHRHAQRGSEMKKIVIAVVALAGLFLAGYLPRRHEQKSAVAATVAEAPAVNVIHPRGDSNVRTLTLPGSLQALEATAVYARATGYVHRWLVDIGDKVTEGQLLAEIDTPDLDQQLQQAMATMGQTRASLEQAAAN